MQSHLKRRHEAISLETEPSETDSQPTGPSLHSFCSLYQGLCKRTSGWIVAHVVSVVSLTVILGAVLVLLIVVF